MTIGARQAGICLVLDWLEDSKMYVKQRTVIILYYAYNATKGAPLALTSDPNDSQWTSPDKINNFDYSGNQSARCPFTAHIRKAGPRNLLPFVSKDYVDSAAIVRAGIPYGNDVSIDTMLLVCG